MSAPVAADRRAANRPGAIAAADMVATGLRAGRRDLASVLDPETLADAIVLVAGRLAPRPDDPDFWDALIALARQLHDAGCWTLHPSPLFTAELVDALVEEAADPGHAPLLSALAVDPAVHEAAGAAAGRPLVSSGYAAYQQLEPGPAQPVHVDRGEFPYILHVVIDESGPGTPGSCLVVHHPERAEHVAVGVGDGVLLAGRGTLHHWAALGDGDHRTLVAIGLTPA